MSTTRSLQLNSALKDMTDLAHDATVVFGGDMNLRDYEVRDLGVRMGLLCSFAFGMVHGARKTSLHVISGS